VTDQTAPASATAEETTDRVFEKLLPTGVTVTPPQRHANPQLREVFIGGAHLDNTMISYVKQGVNCPLVGMSFVVGVQGRGTLNIPGDELMKLLAVGNALVRDLAGLNDPVSVEVKAS
jgi:hypothetical protein